MARVSGRAWVRWTASPCSDTVRAAAAYPVDCGPLTEEQARAGGGCACTVDTALFLQPKNMIVGRSPITRIAYLGDGTCE
jgi:hypothetical protein